MANNNSNPVTEQELKQWDRQRQLALKVAETSETDLGARKWLRLVDQGDRAMDRRIEART
jgi:hypothetical protein